MVGEYRPVIIGGSAIGNFLAYKLTQEGHKPIVIEEHPEVGQPAHCTGLVSERILKLEPLPKSVIKNRLDSAEIHFPDGSTVTIKGKALLLDREAFDRYFYQKAKDAGASYLLGEKLTKAVVSDFVYAKTTKRTFQTDILIGCDGPTSYVRRHFGIFYKIVPAMQAICEYKSEDEGKVQIYFGSRHTDCQFAWVVPEGKTTARVGMFVTEDTDTRLNNFIEFIGAKAVEKRAGIVPFDRPKQSAFANVLLVGDAACQTKASTGGGIVTGMTAAEIAAKAVAKAYEEKNFSEEFLLREYDVKWKEKILDGLNLAFKARKILNRFDDDDLNDVGALAAQHKSIIEKHGDMDFYSGMYNNFKDTPEFKHFITRKILKHPGILFDYFF